MVSRAKGQGAESGIEGRVSRVESRGSKVEGLGSRVEVGEAGQCTLLKALLWRVLISAIPGKRYAPMRRAADTWNRPRQTRWLRVEQEIGVALRHFHMLMLGRKRAHTCSVRYVHSIRVVILILPEKLIHLLFILQQCAAIGTRARSLRSLRRRVSEFGLGREACRAWEGYRRTRAAVEDDITDRAATHSCCGIKQIIAPLQPQFSPGAWLSLIDFADSCLKARRYFRLCTGYAMPGTNVAEAAISLCACCAMSGTAVVSATIAYPLREA